MTPLFGVAAGALWGAVAGGMNDVRIDEAFMRERSQDLEPGASALFAMVSDVHADRLVEELSSHDGMPLRPTFAHENEDASCHVTVVGDAA